MWRRRSAVVAARGVPTQGNKRAAAERYRPRPLRLPRQARAGIMRKMGMESPETAARLMTPAARMTVVGKL